MKNVFKFSLFLLFISCDNEGENTESLEVQIIMPPFNNELEIEKPIELVWSDEFDGTELNLEDWSFDIGDGCPDLCGWGK